MRTGHLTQSVNGAAKLIGGRSGSPPGKHLSHACVVPDLLVGAGVKSLPAVGTEVGGVVDNAPGVMCLVCKSYAQNRLVGFLQVFEVSLFSFPPWGFRSSFSVAACLNYPSNLRSETIGHLTD